MMAQVPAKTPSAAAKGTDLAKADPATGQRESPPPPTSRPWRSLQAAFLSATGSLVRTEELIISPIFFST